MKSFLNKANIENFQVTLKYNNINLDDFLIDNDYKCSVKDVFYVLKKYKNEFFNNEEVLRFTLNTLLDKLLVVNEITKFIDYDNNIDYYHIFHTIGGLKFQMGFKFGIERIKVVLKPLN
jgi:hypothetical protein